MISAFIFDMDGVIADNNRFHKKAWKAFIKNHGFKLTQKDLEQSVFGRRNKEILETLFGRHLFLGEVEKYSQEKEKLYRAAIKNNIPTIKGFREYLAAVKKQAIPMAVATSAPQENVDFILDGLTIRKYFRIVVKETDVKEGKPSPEIYQATALRLGYQPKDCFIFEDSISGIRSAKSAGAKVGVPLTTLTKEEAEKEKPDLIFKDFTDRRLYKLIKNG